MESRALVVIDIQNDITKNYKDVIDNINAAIGWAVSKNMHIAYIKHNNLSPFIPKFKPNTKGVDFVPEMKIASENVFVKNKSNALTSKEFVDFINKNKIKEFYVAGADAVACVKATCTSMAQSGYAVHILADCITSYNRKKIPQMLKYYERKGCIVEHSRIA